MRSSTLFCRAAEVALLFFVGYLVGAVLKGGAL